MLQIPSFPGCEKIIQDVFSTMKFDYDPAAIRGMYYASILRDLGVMNEAFIAKAKKNYTENDLIIARNKLVLRYSLITNTNMLIETFHEDLQALESVNDAKAAAASPLGRQIFKYCSDFWADAKVQCDDAFAIMTPVS